MPERGTAQGGGKGHFLVQKRRICPGDETGHRHFVLTTGGEVEEEGRELVAGWVWSSSCWRLLAV